MSVLNPVGLTRRNSKWPPDCNVFAFATGFRNLVAEEGVHRPDQKKCKSSGQLRSDTSLESDEANAFFTDPSGSASM